MYHLMSSIVAFVLLLASTCRPAPAFALNILITNDDGVEASSIHALYQVLKANGHQVLIVSETQDNSGKGGAADFFKPIGPLQSDSRAGFIKAGAPGTGQLAGFDDIYYVDATPYAATLFGIDIAAQHVWHKNPDLVISGPNYGNNTGLLNNSSGTVNAALIAINRGIPAIAVSAAVPVRFKPFSMLRTGDPEFENAALVAHIVETLERQRHGPNAKLLADGTALNVNVPAYSPGTAARLGIVLTRESIDLGGCADILGRSVPGRWREAICNRGTRAARSVDSSPNVARDSAFRTVCDSVGRGGGIGDQRQSRGRRKDRQASRSHAAVALAEKRSSRDAAVSERSFHVLAFAFALCKYQDCGQLGLGQLA